MILPRLRSALIAMLEELPDTLTGLGASENGYARLYRGWMHSPQTVRGAARRCGVFDEREAGEMLDDLAQGPAPLVFGLGDPPFEASEETRYHQSKVALTELVRAVVEGKMISPATTRSSAGGRHALDQRTALALGCAEPLIGCTLTPHSAACA
jgi:hypothetical protein